MSLLDSLFGVVANAVQQHASADTPGPAYDPNPILGALSGLFGQAAQNNGQQFNGYQQGADYSQHQGGGVGGLLGGLFGGGGGGNVLSSNSDRYGDPGAAGNVQSSNADPYGDPGAPSNVQSSNADPYGDPGRQ